MSCAMPVPVEEGEETWPELVARIRQLAPGTGVKIHFGDGGSFTVRHEVDGGVRYRHDNDDWRYAPSLAAIARAIGSGIAARAQA